MSSKTTFWFAAVVALALFGSSVFAVPLQVIDVLPTVDTNTPASVQGQLQKEVKSPDAPVETPAVVAETEKSQQLQQQDGKTEEAVQLALPSEVPPVAADAESGPGPKTEPGNPAADSDIEIIDISNLVPATSSPVKPSLAAPSNSGAKMPTPPVPAYNKPKPYYPGNVETVVKFGSDLPLAFMEMLQPFHHAFQPFQQPFQQSFPTFHQTSYNQPPKHQQQPLGASIDPFDPFANNPIVRSPFNQLVEEYTNQFRNMLNTFDKSMSQMKTNLGEPQSIPDKPVSKVTSKTEVIDGHLVQTNETTYSNGDDNHKTFYRFKEIQVLPDERTQKITSENTVSVSKDERDEETNEIKRDDDSPPIGMLVASSAVVDGESKPNLIKKVA